MLLRSRSSSHQSRRNGIVLCIYMASWLSRHRTGTTDYLWLFAFILFIGVSVYRPHPAKSANFFNGNRTPPPNATPQFGKPQLTTQYGFAEEHEGASHEDEAVLADQHACSALQDEDRVIGRFASFVKQVCALGISKKEKEGHWKQMATKKVNCCFVTQKRTEDTKPFWS